MCMYIFLQLLNNVLSGKIYSQHLNTHVQNKQVNCYTQ